MRRCPLLLVLLVVAPLCALLGSGTASAAVRGPVDVRFLQANVGNINVAGCNDQIVKLCLAPVEDRAAAAIRRLSPELVALQETLPDQVCEQTPATSPSLRNPADLCAPATRRKGDQVDRLLPPAHYDTRCNTPLTGATYPPPWDCLGVDRARGRIESFSTRPPVKGCDNGFTVNVAVVVLDGRRLQLTSAHPESGSGAGQGGGPTRQECRARQLRDLFAFLGSRPALPAVVSGDFNLDPYRNDDVSIQVWKRFVGKTGRPYLYRSGIAEAADPPLSDNNSGASQNDPTGLVLDGPTQVGVAQAGGTLDHVATSAAITGPCLTLDGTSAARARLDGGGGMDHKAISCRLRLADAGSRQPAAGGAPTARPSAAAPRSDRLPTTGSPVGLGALASALLVAGLLTVRRTPAGSRP